MEDGGQSFAGELRIRRGFVPTDATDRKIFLACGKATELPSGRSGPIGFVAETVQSFAEREGAPVFDERKLPILGILVATGIDEFLVLGVGDLEFVDEEIVQFDPIMACGI